MVGSINHDTHRRPIFEGINRIIPLADDILKLRAECSICGKPALFTVRTTPVIDNNWIGGTEAYATLCRVHYSQLKMSPGLQYTHIDHLKNDTIKEGMKELQEMDGRIDVMAIQTASQNMGFTGLQGGGMLPPWNEANKALQQNYCSIEMEQNKELMEKFLLLPMTDLDWEALEKNDAPTSSTVICNFMKIILRLEKREGKEIFGLFDPYDLINTRKTIQIPSNPERVLQILHTGEYHWIFVTIYPTEIIIEDSLGTHLNATIIESLQRLIPEQYKIKMIRWNNKKYKEGNMQCGPISSCCPHPENIWGE